MRAGRSVFRPEMLVRESFGHGLCNRQRVPDDLVIEQQDGHEAGGRILRNLIGSGIDIQRDSVLRELDARLFEQEPGPERPAGIIFVAYNEFQWSTGFKRRPPRIISQKPVKLRPDVIEFQSFFRVDRSRCGR